MLGGYVSLLDMFDGAGPGASGSEFKGGPVSGLLNQLGVRPAGYRQRTAGMDQMSPMRPRQAVASPSPVSETPLSPPMSVDPRINATWGRQRGMTDPVVAPPMYSGRGPVGMPVDPAIAAVLDPDALAALQYLRSIGWND